MKGVNEYAKIFINWIYCANYYHDRKNRIKKSGTGYNTESIGLIGGYYRVNGEHFGMANLNSV